MNWLSWPIAALGVALVAVVVIVRRVPKEETIDNKPNVYDADENYELVDDGELLSVRNDFPPAARKLWRN